MSLPKGWKERKRALRLRSRRVFPMQIGTIPGQPDHEVVRVFMGNLKDRTTLFHAYVRKKRKTQPGVTKRDHWTTREILEEWRDRATMPLHRATITDGMP